MKLLIEIDEHSKNTIDKNAEFADGAECDILPECIFTSLIESVKNGSVIPDNATNESKTGHWIIDDKEGNRIWHCHCSECNKDPQDYIGGTENWWLVRLPNNCPNCGAKMNKEGE